MDYYGLIFSYISAELIAKIIRSSFILLGGLFFIGLMQRVLQRMRSDYISEHIRFLLVRGTWYAGCALIAIMLLAEMGFHVGTILGVAGIAGAALGFASQTSLSNVISGFFLLAEGSYSVGDVITVSGTTGTIVGIGLLSLKLRQLDGTFVRIPNEQLIKSLFINLSYYNERRFDFHITVSHKEDVARVIDVVHDVIRLNKYTAGTQEPMIICDALTESGTTLFIGAWGYKDTYTALKKTIIAEIKQRLDDEGIQMSRPALVVSMESSK